MGEEEQARQFVASIEGDDFANELFSDEEIKNLCEEREKIGDVNYRVIVIRRAIEAIKALVGPMKKTPAARLVVEREFRKWAEELGLRPSHASIFRPYVVVGYFINSAHEIRAAAIETSLAVATNEAAMSRWSALRWLSGWVPSMGSTVE